MTMRYISTRGDAPPIGFLAAAEAGLAPDLGLYVPDHLPHLAPADIEAARVGDYADTANRVMRPFVGADIPAPVMTGLLKDSYASFSPRGVAPLREVGEGLYLLELFHGPTLAFKDVALQFLGRLFAHALSARKGRATIVGATSGDTGSAAIAAFQNNPAVNVFILHPRGRVSEVQRRQMTTVRAPNIHNIAVEGSFDDCQRLVKALFADVAFRDDMQLSAVNSINWARILAQVVYYVQAAAMLGDQTPAFCVPTGNFGNIYAGYIARAMGAPISRLIAATNSNDILHRFFTTGEMAAQGVIPTLSPSMDIQVSSNFERLLFDLLGRDGARVAGVMRGFQSGQSYDLDAGAMVQARSVFSSGRVDDAGTLREMQEMQAAHGLVVDPHTAVGVSVARAYLRDHPGATVVALATAHPAKFPDAVCRATGSAPAVPPALRDIMAGEERCTTLPADLLTLQDFMRSHA